MNQCDSSGGWDGVQSVSPISDCWDVQPVECVHVKRCVLLVLSAEPFLPLFRWADLCCCWEEHVCSLSQTLLSGKLQNKDTIGEAFVVESSQNRGVSERQEGIQVMHCP